MFKSGLFENFGESLIIEPQLGQKMYSDLTLYPQL